MSRATRFIAFASVAALGTTALAVVAWPRDPVPRPRLESGLVLKSRKLPASRSFESEAEGGHGDGRAAATGTPPALGALFRESFLSPGKPDSSEHRAHHRDGVDPSKASRTRQWVLLRTPNRVEIQWLGTDRTEVWKRSPRGQISHEAMFGEERLRVLYTQGDLRSLEVGPRWFRLSRLIEGPPAELGLTRVAEEASPWGPATRYRGTRAGVAVELAWIEKHELPLLITRGGHHQSVVRLVALHPIEESPWPSKSLADFEPIDFADLGDRESDPRIARLLNTHPGLHAGHAH